MEKKPIGSGYKPISEGGPKGIGVASPTPRTLAEAYIDKCIHYNGTVNKECRVNIEYAKVQDTSERPFRLPCFQRDGITDRCNCAAFPTLEEAREREARVKEKLKQTGIARQAIVTLTNGKRSTSGELACPVCESGRLHFSVAYNGHIHAQCTTETCVRWME